MGSLMAGWSSQVLADDHKARLMRNRSLTKEEVEAFWRRQHGGTKPAVEHDAGEVVITSPLATSTRVRSMPPSTSSACSEPSSPAATQDDGGSPSTSRDWWTRSSWAFLNEPPPPPRAARVGSTRPDRVTGTAARTRTTPVSIDDDM